MLTVNCQEVEIKLFGYLTRRSGMECHYQAYACMMVQKAKGGQWRTTQNVEFDGRLDRSMDTKCLDNLL
jgi:hypothetical protein